MAMQTYEQALENIPNELKPCPFCGKKAISRAQKTFVYNDERYFGIVYKVGCFECEMYLTGVKKYFPCDNGRIEVVEDEYAQIVQKWNDRK